MEEIRKSVQAVFPDMDSDKLDKVVECLEDLGTSSLADLAFVEVEDMKGILKPIQCRRLVIAWSRKGVYIMFTILYFLFNINPLSAELSIEIFSHLSCAALPRLQNLCDWKYCFYGKLWRCKCAFG